MAVGRSSILDAYNRALAGKAAPPTPAPPVGPSVSGYGGARTNRGGGASVTTGGGTSGGGLWAGLPISSKPLIDQIRELSDSQAAQWVAADGVPTQATFWSATGGDPNANYGTSDDGTPLTGNMTTDLLKAGLTERERDWVLAYRASTSANGGADGVYRNAIDNRFEWRVVNGVGQSYANDRTALEIKYVAHKTPWSWWVWMWAQDVIGQRVANAAKDAAADAAKHPAPPVAQPRPPTTPSSSSGILWAAAGAAALYITLR